MTTLQPSPNPGIFIELSPLVRGGWECWVCNAFTCFEVTIITSRGLRNLPCCSVECYAYLPAAYERFVEMQANDHLSYGA